MEGILSGNGLCLEGVMYGGGFVRRGFCPRTSGEAPIASDGQTSMYQEGHCVRRRRSKYTYDGENSCMVLRLSLRGKLMRVIIEYVMSQVA